ncbi:hypothetical protein CCR94_09265 [Rhodoblastus sphagnicola]|uniref:Uncharacterized protein n=1 Tax=Rhodoblastus sphagnicola TaxID=333368 RepID=A0A2S6NA71_9HYPH|nr:hypothetical protein CCR94_09265 [Rhodoblastus sphagnicola]
MMREWDPIGVSDDPEAWDEYDAYAGRVYVMLMDERASAEAIAAYLDAAATGHMGLSPSHLLTEASRTTADTLVALRPEFELH